MGCGLYYTPAAAGEGGGFQGVRALNPLLPSGPLGWRITVTLGPLSSPTLFSREIRRSGRFFSLHDQQQNVL